MKTIGKRLACILMTVLLLLPLCSSFTASAATGSTTPIVYVPGQGHALYAADGTQIYPLELPDGYIDAAVKACMPSFMKAVTTNKWEEYSALLASKIQPIFEDIALDENGEASDGSGCGWTWSRSSLRNTKKNGVYGLQDYMFYYDWRLDPCDNAVRLSRYINDVLYVTGASKVNLLGRCEGACVTTAYIAQYGIAKVNDYVLYSQAASGVNTVSGTFSGKLELNSEAIDRYSTNNLSLEDQMLDELLHSTLEVAADTNGLDLAANTFNSVYAKAAKNVMPGLILGTYGTMPGIWSMMIDSDYDTAISLVFAGREDEYAGLLAKIENYRNTVGAKINTLLKRASNAGVGIANITKYGFQAPPLFYNNNEISDGTASLCNTSLGATCALAGETLGDSYIEQRTAQGYGSYIAPDNQVDVSTALLASRTWIVKGLGHRVFPACMDVLLNRFFALDGEMTVFTDAAFPQFMVYDSTTQTVSPMTEENCKVNDWEEDRSAFASFYRFFKVIFQYLRKLFISLFGTLM